MDVHSIYHTQSGPISCFSTSELVSARCFLLTHHRPLVSRDVMQSLKEFQKKTNASKRTSFPWRKAISGSITSRAALLFTSSQSLLFLGLFFCGFKGQLLAFINLKVTDWLLSVKTKTLKWWACQDWCARSGTWYWYFQLQIAAVLTWQVVFIPVSAVVSQ